MKKIISVLLLLISINSLSQLIDTAQTLTSSDVSQILSYEIPNHSTGYAEIILIGKDAQDSCVIDKRFFTWSGYNIINSGIITADFSINKSGYNVLFSVDDSILNISVKGPTESGLMKWKAYANFYANSAIVSSQLPLDGNSLNLTSANSEHLYRSTDLVLTGPFSIEIEAQGLVQNGTYIPLFANNSTGNRLLLSGISGIVALNIGGSSLITKPITVDVGLNHTYKLYKNASNEVYFQVDNESPILMITTSNSFSIRYIGKASSSFKITGVINGFKINADDFTLSEGSGTTLTSSNGLQTWNISSAAGTTHINENVWFVAPNPTASIQVINKGVGGNNAYDMDLRFNADVNPYAPDAVIITPGTNDAINSTNHLTPAQFKTHLLSMVNKAIALGATPYIWNIPPVIDSYKKADHDYTAIYGDESTFDLNIDILPQYRAKVDEVATETGAIVLDILSVFTANGDPAITLTSYLRNEINAVGETDGVHLTPAGRQALADYIAPFLVGKTKIVWIGDSNVAAGGSTSMCILISLLLNS